MIVNNNTTILGKNSQLVYTGFSPEILRGGKSLDAYADTSHYSLVVTIVMDL